MKRFAAIYFGLCIAVQAIPAAAPATHYRIEVEVHVTDAQALCKHAWAVALADHGPAITEMLTMTRGEFAPLKCLATTYQKLAPDGVVSAGMHVMEVSE